jgi:hypothetical protein
LKLADTFTERNSAFGHYCQFNGYHTEKENDHPRSLVAGISPFLPNLFETGFRGRLLSGITVGLVALPLAMAFGIASGVTPQAGLCTAIVAGGLIFALGGSKLQIGGPTGAPFLPSSSGGCET